jgi:hypothetical protein
MSALQRWIWGGSGTFHDIVTSDQNWKVVQYLAGGVAIAAGTIATGGALAEAMAAAEETAGSAALYSRAGPSVWAFLTALHKTGALDPVEQELEYEYATLTPALQTEAQILTARLSQLQSAMHPAAANGGRTLAIMRTNSLDVVGAGVRDLSPAMRNMLTNWEVAAKLFTRHAEPTVMVAADRLQHIYPAGFMPRILVTTTIICPQCAYLIYFSGGTLFGPRGAVWPQ